MLQLSCSSSMDLENKVSNYININNTDEQGYDENLREGREQQQIIVIEGYTHNLCGEKRFVFTHSLRFVISISASALSVLCGPPASNGRIGLAASYKQQTVSDDDITQDLSELGFLVLDLQSVKVILLGTFLFFYTHKE